jgi:pyruvate,water dikinase
VVTRALTPGLALALAGIAGIVCDSGGLLDHGAAMARELGIPYVVGASDVYDRCHDGQRIAVDPSSGTVTLLD